MSKWMIIAPHAGDEVFSSAGGFLAKLACLLEEQKVLLQAQEKPFVLYLTVADYEDESKRYISKDQVMREIYEVSQLLNFNYDILYHGRNYYNNIVNDTETAKKVIRQIDFIKPEWLFLPEGDPSTIHWSYDTCLFNDLISTRIANYCNRLTNILYYGNIFGDFKIELIRRDVNFKEKAARLYKSLIKKAPHPFSWESLYYAMVQNGIFSRKDFMESFKIKQILSPTDLFDFSKLEKVEQTYTVEEILDPMLDDILAQEERR